MVLPEPVDVGASLRDARERHGLTLDQLAHITKIRASVLRDIERNRRDVLPTTIFLRGFLRAYAREVGLDPDQTTHRYLDQFASVPPVEPVVPAPAPEADRAEAELNWKALSNVGILGAIACVVIVYGLAHRNTAAVAAARPPQASEAVSKPSPPVPQTRAEVGTGGSASTAAVGATGRTLRITLQATAVCWVSATVDGSRAFYRLMQPGDRRELQVNNAMVLRVGDPTALSLAIDGTAVRPLGAAGRAVTVQITPDNFRQFLSR